MTEAAAPSRTMKAAESVARSMRRKIIDGSLAEGEALPSEARLIETFSVSRPTLREAFRVLESEGLIEVHRGSRGGARVRVPTEDVVARYAGLVLEHRQTTIGDVATARAVLEPPCAAAIATSDAIAALRANVEFAESLEDDPAAQLAAQHEFHTLLVRGAGNQTIAVLHGAIERIIDAADTQWVRIAGSLASNAGHEGARAHRRLVELLEAGDAPRAEALWRKHIRATSDYQAGSVGASKVLDLF
jgi:DNA-binding FadR family transcriptional regulator